MTAKERKQLAELAVFVEQWAKKQLALNPLSVPRAVLLVAQGTTELLTGEETDGTHKGAA